MSEVIHTLNYLSVLIQKPFKLKIMRKDKT